MKVLLTGANGFIARNIANHLDTKHTVIRTSRQTLNILDEQAVTTYLSQNKIDVVIHSAVSGGRRTQTDGFGVLVDNLKMFDNLLLNKNKFTSLIHFGSGAEFDRRKDIKMAKETDDSEPVDYYGLSKKIIKREIDKTDNFYNLRIFGCFGADEKEDRFIKSAIRNVKNNQKILIHQNRYMDFISIKDVCTTVQHYIENMGKKDLQRDINLCYTTRVSLLDIANKINALLGKPLKNVEIDHCGLSAEYTGDGTQLSKLGLQLDGLDESLKKLI